MVFLFVVTIGVLSVFLLAEVIGFSIMSVALRTGGQGRWMTGFTAALVVLGKAQSLLVFAALLVLRIIALILPFALVGLLIAMWYLTEFDINYYLTFKPPEFWAAAILIGLLVLAMAAVLILRMSAWGLGLHLVLFANVAPKEAFAASAERVELSAALMFWFATGAIAAPWLASVLIDAFGPPALFAMIAVGHAILVVFGLARMRRRDTPAERTPYIYAPRTTFMIGRLLGRSRDRR